MIGWGRDIAGEISPTPASALPSVEIAAGGYHTVVRRADGSIGCFGRNIEGQCGTPAGLTAAASIDARGFNTAAVLVDGSLRIWGANSNQQLNIPANLGTVRKVSLGSGFVSVIRTDGTVACWGLNDVGQCNVPADLGIVASVSAGYAHVATVGASGQVRCWGSNASGQCAPPSDLGVVSQVAAGGYHNAALRIDGAVRCWGAGQSDSGGINFGQSQVPASLGTVIQVSCGEYHTLALRSDGTVRAWGYGGNSQTTVPQGLVGVRQIAAGGRHSVALREGGTVVCWGGFSLNFGQTRVPTDSGIVSTVSLGRAHTIYRKQDGTLVGRGSNSWGESSPPADLGVVSSFVSCAYGNLAIMPNGSVRYWGSNFNNEQSIPAGLAQGIVTRVAIGKYAGHLVALRNDGVVFCWGSNTNGKATTPANLPPAREIGAGVEHTLAILNDGTIRAWGQNANGCCDPQTDLTDFVSVTGGGGWSMALRQNGLVRTWGSDTGAGQTMRTPADLSGVVQIAAGWNHAVALKSDGTVRIWGQNTEGALNMPAGLRNVTQIAADAEHTIALLGPTVSDCGNAGGAGTATVSVNGGYWRNVGNWSWSNGGSPQVPGAGTDVDLGVFGSVASDCLSHARTLTARAGSTLIVNADFAGASPADTSITVGVSATLAGRLWLVGSGATVLPDSLDIPVLSTPALQGFFDIIESTIPPPKGKFLTLVPTASLGGGVTYRLRLLPLSTSASLTDADAGAFPGSVVAAETMDLNRDGLDDLALAIDFGTTLNGRVQVLLATPGGGLGESRLVTVPPRPTCLATGDVDGDGWDDLVVGIASDSTARLYLGSATGGGSLVPSTVYAVNGQPLSTVVVPPVGGSLKFGAAASVAVGSSGGAGTGAGNKVAIYSASGTTPAQTVPVAPAPSAIGRRGRIIVTGGSSSSNAGEGLLINGLLVTIAPGAGGTFAVAQSIAVPGAPVLLDVADIDGDGLEEVVTANRNPQPQGAGIPLPAFSLFRGQGAGFGEAVPFAPLGASSGLDVAMVDVDSDGDRDLVCVQRTVGSNSAAVLVRIDTPGPGGAFTFGDTTPVAATSPVLTARGNLDGLGGDDLYLVDANSAAFKGGGEGGFAIPLLGTAPSCPGDVDGDGSVNGNDLAAVLAQWGTVGAADVNRDGIVDGNDLAVVLAAWGICPGAASAK